MLDARPLFAATLALTLAFSCAKGKTTIESGGAGGDDATTTEPTGGAGQGGHATTTSASGGAGGATSTSAGGAAADAGSDAAVGGPCQQASDCAGLSDQCNQGTCVNGLCARVAANEFGACDDGQFCTESEACTNGVCGGGVPKTCAGGDSCHVGTCDEAKKACTLAPGNDGAQCDDGDPCTQTAACSGGACVQQTTKDCSFLNGTCATGTCDPKKGCVIAPNPDGTACDDGLYCTIGDACKAGACTGKPNTCAPPGADICMVGQCDEGAKSCVAVPGNDGKACNDGSTCTGGETCSAGKCQGGKPANEGASCDDGNACTGGTTCAGGLCANAKSQIAQCINGDGCCPAGCGKQDTDCIDLTGVFAQYLSEGRGVYLWKTPEPCAPLANYQTFCEGHGLKWWAPKTQADVDQLISFAFALDNTHTWIQTYGSVVTTLGGQANGFNLSVDDASCVEGSSSGWTAFRKWACSMCDPESNAKQSDDNQSCCWDKGHPYDWFVCQD